MEKKASGTKTVGKSGDGTDKEENGRSSDSARKFIRKVKEELGEWMKMVSVRRTSRENRRERFCR